MFYSLTGEIIFTDENSVAVDCGGVGFRCSTTLYTLRQLGPVGSKVTLFTHLNVREDSFDLFGFFDKNELECFKLLISVTGVGPKAGLAILSQLTPDKLALCIATGDIKTITGAQGVGTKLAQRVVLELKGKLKSGLPGGMDSTLADAAGIAGESGPGGEAVSALVMLGYSQSEASVAVSRLESGLSTEQLIKQALKSLARQ